MGTSLDRPGIGIVTALPVECFAVQTIMDDLEEAPGSDDRFMYYLGTVPSRAPGVPHKIVLCLLSQDGGIAAAHGCANLAVTWPVQHIIMSGIACGVPNLDDPERHVRLGDILVAEDVIPYDHLRVEPDAQRVRRPAARPSVVLRTAARRLRVEEEAGSRPWERWLDVRRRPDLGEYARPDASTDVLFDDATGQRIRHPPPSRSKHVPGKPKVHYGPIGSGGRLIRSSAERDRLVREHGLIGLDMEGDGIADAAYLQGLDWFMVRGVSDYGSQKRDTWQRNAALAAAAYTRVLLERLNPSPTRRLPPTERPDASGAQHRDATGVEHPDAPGVDRARLAAALLETHAMRDQAGRDRILSMLPPSYADRISRARDAHHDSLGFVNALAEVRGGLGLLLELLRAVEGGDSLPVRRFARLLMED
jgi:nucleoside phosphorylase